MAKSNGKKGMSLEEFGKMMGFEAPSPPPSSTNKFINRKQNSNTGLQYKGNVGLLFNKRYYENEGNSTLNYDDLKANTDFFKLKHQVFDEYELNNFSFQNFDNEPINLKTTYPGLVVGLGYGHGIKAEGEFKLGFSFDYASGLPVIVGSTVKGLLRSIFPNRKLHKNTVSNIKDSKEKYIKAELLKLGLEVPNDNILFVDKLEQAIFDGYIGESPNSTNGYLPIYQRDMFYDAIILSGNANKKVFGDDSITPHGENPLKNPTPLLFLKILPNVTFQFNFDLKDVTIDEICITAEIKKQLFKQILLDFGIGAKTNVGYGQFSEI
jgi:CRISPR-associated protein Cmr6